MSLQAISGKSCFRMPFLCRPATIWPPRTHPKTWFGGLSPAAEVERPKLNIVLQFGEGAARKIAQFYNSEKARNRIAPQLCISDQGHPRKRAMFCNSEKTRNRISLQLCIFEQGHTRKRAQLCSSAVLEKWKWQTRKWAETSLKLVFTNQQIRQEVWKSMCRLHHKGCPSPKRGCEVRQDIYEKVGFKIRKTS